MSTEALERDVEALMLALTDAYGKAAVTPGGLSWLRVHYVPARRLIRRLVRRLSSIREPAPDIDESQPFVVAHHSAAIGYVSYDVTDAGVAYVLGRQHDEPQPEPATARPEGTEPPTGVAGTPVNPVCAVSWSSRHAATLLPVLLELADRGVPTTVVDASTEPEQRFPEPQTPGITVVRLPDAVFAPEGAPPIPWEGLLADNLYASAGGHGLSLGRLARLVSYVVVRSAGCTQPSWAAALRAERWLDEVLALLRPQVLVCSNDTSPLGVIAVGAAERVGADTVYVQHGAWIDSQVGWRAQHCRHIAVMGARDVRVAQNWTRRADARTHLVGQPRFDVLADIDRTWHRAYLRDLMEEQAQIQPPKIAVWACQPFSEQRLAGQFHVVAEGLRNATRRWGLVIAPHPAQSMSAFIPLLDSAKDIAVAVAATDVGARGCLAGADALISASSTCGIEALLLDVPVLELTLPATQTLELAEYGAAQRCTSAAEITVSLARIDRTPAAVRIPDAAKDSICRWNGRSAVAVADLVVGAMAESSASRRTSPTKLKDHP